MEPEEARQTVQRLEFHYTPKHGSWLSIAEVELSHLHRQCLNRRLQDITVAKGEVKAWLKRKNSEASPVDWQFIINNAWIELKSFTQLLKITLKLMKHRSTEG